MLERQDRRAPGVPRVPVERVVEICGRDARVPAFEAESVELSGRGMHVRTPYLPELSAPLVCRVEDRGREIVVEGLVAWRRETESGGEFGVKFTALDSGSVETLKDLCGLRRPEERPVEPEADRSASEGDEPPAPPRGAPVKLHIEGLGAPMKARVRRGSTRRLHVGSNLEFLKVGKNLEIEDVERQGRKGARIDSVSVAIDPETMVPELVVTLRYDGAEDTTPEPSVVGQSAADLSGASESIPEVDGGSAEEAVDLDAEGDDDTDENPFADRLQILSQQAAKAARVTGAVLARVGVGAASTMNRLAHEAGDRIGQMRTQRARVQKRRVTASPPGGALSSQGHRLRPQSGARSNAPPQKKQGGKAMIAGAAMVAVALAGGVYALTGSGDSDKESAKAPATDVAPEPLAVAPPAAKVAPAAPVEKAGPPKNEKGIVANVPLFGPTPMATLEPAPLEPPPDDIEAEPESIAPDQRFEDEGEDAKSKNPKDVEPWGNGRLELPFVHRLKLDGPGSALQGKKRSTGFSVFIPGRKVLGSGRTIAKRDDRIAEVRTENESSGARVVFVFRGTIPAYKVRLKDSDVEFFISSPKKSR